MSDPMAPGAALLTRCGRWIVRPGEPGTLLSDTIPATERPWTATRSTGTARRCAAHYAAHREERLAYQRAYRAAHREEERAYQRAYYAAHRETIREQRRASPPPLPPMTQPAPDEAGGDP